jgi:hypothetical protein
MEEGLVKGDMNAGGEILGYSIFVDYKPQTANELRCISQVCSAVLKENEADETDSNPEIALI